MIKQNFLQPLSSWKSGGKLKICIGVDIGGSGFRTRISNANNKKQCVDISHIKAQSTKMLIESLTSIQNSINKTFHTFESRGAAFAIAGPIKDGKVILTNWPGKPEVRTLSLDDLPQRLFPKRKTSFLNDLEAGAYGIISANEQKILEPNFVQLWQKEAPKGPIVSNTRTAVMALGSGLGVALIVKNPLRNDRFVLPCELGHIQIPIVFKKDPNSTLEYSLLQHISDYYYKGRQAPEFEDTTSGRGIKLCYQFFLQKNEGIRKNLDEFNAAEIASNARKGEKTAKMALFWCHKMYIRLAKLIATSMQCDSVILALENQVKDKTFVDSISSKLKDEFYNFVRPEWMEGIRVYSQIKVLNFNILGCDYVAHQNASK